MRRRGAFGRVDIARKAVEHNERLDSVFFRSPRSYINLVAQIEITGWYATDAPVR